MGEKTTVDLSPAAVRHIAKALTDAAGKLATDIVAGFNSATLGAAADALHGELLHGEPFTRTTDERDAHLPQGAEVVAFIEPNARSIRWIGTEQVSQVPAGWRPLLLGPTVKR